MRSITQPNRKRPEVELGHKMAKLIFIHNAAVNWYNEQLRISHTTYTPENREHAIRAIDNLLAVSVETALASAE